MLRHYSITYTQSFHARHGLLAVGRMGNLLCVHLSYVCPEKSSEFFLCFTSKPNEHGIFWNLYLYIYKSVEGVCLYTDNFCDILCFCRLLTKPRRSETFSLWCLFVPPLLKNCWLNFNQLDIRNLTYLEHVIDHGYTRVAHCVTARWRNFSHYCRPLR